MNREEFIGKLQMVYVGDRNAIDEIVEDNQKLKNLLVYSKVEIDRLNNIIDELEEIINYEIQEWKDTDDELMKARVQEDKHILEVIEELKENNK